MMRITIIGSMLAFAAVGCVYDVEESGGGSTAWEPTVEPWEAPPSTELEIGNAHIAGVAGNVQVDAPALVFQADSYGSEDMVELRARGEQGVLMQLFTFRDGLDSLPLGETIEIDPQDYVGVPFVEAMACSGADNGVWDYDRTPDQLNVRVDPDPIDGSLRVEVVGLYPVLIGEGHTVIGATFTVPATGDL